MSGRMLQSLSCTTHPSTEFVNCGICHFNRKLRPLMPEFKADQV